MFKLQKLNDEKVDVVKIKEEKVHGGELFPINFFQLFIVSKKKGIPMVCHTSISDDSGQDQITQLVQMLQEEAEGPKKEKDKPSAAAWPIWPLNQEESDSDEEDDKKEEKTKTDYTIIFDDLSGQIKNSKSLQALARSNRHWRCRVIISSQHLCDIPPGVRTNMDFWITFKGQPVDKLKQIWQESDVGITYDLFEQMYQEAVKPAFGFFAT